LKIPQNSINPFPRLRHRPLFHSLLPILLSAYGNINGPGGQSVFTDGVQPTLVYHYYDGNNGAPTLGIDRLGFDSSGWPFVQ
jgi:hypothetical protein